MLSFCEFNPTCFALNPQEMLEITLSLNMLKYTAQIDVLGVALCSLFGAEVRSCCMLWRCKFIWSHSDLPYFALFGARSQILLSKMTSDQGVHFVDRRTQVSSGWPRIVTRSCQLLVIDLACLCYPAAPAACILDG